MTTASAKPVPASYWVLPGKFLAGQYPVPGREDESASNQRLAAFLEAGFTVFIDLTRPDEVPSYLPALNKNAARYQAAIDYQRFAIGDRGLPTRVQMTALLDAIDSALAAGKKVYLHCWGGIGRTGTTVGCWLVRHGLTGEAALLRLNELYRTSEQSCVFPHSPETDAQMRFIVDYRE